MERNQVLPPDQSRKMLYDFIDGVPLTGQQRRNLLYAVDSLYAAATPVVRNATGNEQAPVTKLAEVGQDKKKN